LKDKQTPLDNIIKFQMGSSVDDTNKLISILEEQLKKEKDFGVIIVREGEQKNVPEARKLFSDWLKSNKSLLKRYCYGLAMVTASEGMQKVYKPVARFMISKTYGCPGDLFVKEEDATAWLLNQQNIFGK
jgi:hypothetical protein